jgi:hypothetical protein
MRGFGYCVFGALLLLFLWMGASYHYTVVADFAATYGEPNAGESPTVHEKRQKQD